MSDRLDQCCNRLKAEINTAETCLAQAGHHVSSAAEAGVDALETRLKDALAKCEARREQAAQSGQRIKQFIEEAKHNAVARFEEWKTNREIAKIEKHADQKEQQAADAIGLAAFALLEAEVAIVEALKARKIALEVAG
jgi:hypothetical protein